MKPPAYFEGIRKQASDRWVQLEKDPDLAGPWHQLFKQVQSPRHVLSELLQNADDAGASRARVVVSGSEFLFEHDGEDFTEEHFLSLCRFGYSNKRALHTIGFRGIGFKSIFSLGDEVRLTTPTLAVSFKRERFTEPVWRESSNKEKTSTRVAVSIKDSHRERELKKNLDDWAASPMSLLFFRNLRRLEIDSKEIRWSSLGHGPVDNSEWVALVGQEDRQLLLLRSSPERFPADAMEEIQQERMLGLTEDFELPPSTVELVLGAEGRLYVVLPTGVVTELPFACNAPFLQDPARLKIKDPEISPTNRWLLERAGRLAGNHLLAWLAMEHLPLEERCSAYDLLPDVNRNASGLDGQCGTIAELATAGVIADQRLLVTEDGTLVKSKEAVVVPTELKEVWSPQQVANLLDGQRRPPLHGFIGGERKTKLKNWNLVDEIDKPALLQCLKDNRPPRPGSWSRLAALWSYVATDLLAYPLNAWADTYNLVPVKDQDALHSGQGVVRLGDRINQLPDADQSFISTLLSHVDPDWIRFLAKDPSSDDIHKIVKPEVLASAQALLAHLGLATTTDLRKVLSRSAETILERRQSTTSDWVQLAHIAARLSLPVPESFRYVTLGGELRNTQSAPVVDLDGGLEDLIPESLKEQTLLHSQYSQNLGGEFQDKWVAWVASGRSELKTFVAPEESQRWLLNSDAARQFVARRTGHPLACVVMTDEATHLQDTDFDSEMWEHWTRLSTSSDKIWVTITQRILQQGSKYLQGRSEAFLLQIGRRGKTRTVIPILVAQKAVRNGTLLSQWISRLRELPCLVDTRGVPRLPGELLRRTPQTEPVLGIEHFISAEIDREANVPLLDLLGVRTVPTGPESILDRLRALAGTDNPPVREVEKWYLRLDSMLNTGSTESHETTRNALMTEPLILTEDLTWHRADAVFISAGDEDVPGLPVLRPSVQDLALWRRIGVAERPTVELAIAWLSTIASGTRPPSPDAKRIRALLSRHAERIWSEAGHWLNISGEWIPTTELAFSVTIDSRMANAHLFPTVRRRVADFTHLPIDVSARSPFSMLPRLSAIVEDRLEDIPVDRRAESRPWLQTLARTLSRARFDEEEETERVRRVANRLLDTLWCTVPAISVVPYIDGVPVGTARRAEVVWVEDRIFVSPNSSARLARLVPEELAKAFHRADVRALLDYSFERNPDDVLDYIRENFQLVDSEEPLSEGDTEALLTRRAETLQAVEAVDCPRPLPRAVTSNNELSPSPDPDETRVEDEPSDAEAPATRVKSDHRAPSQPAVEPKQPSLIERFAKARGFRPRGDGSFLHPEGNSLRREPGTLFTWTLYDATGNVIRAFHGITHCLELSPLELKHEAWALLSERPDTHALILLDPSGEPVEVSGTLLRDLHQRGKIELFPSSYRLGYRG